MNYRQSFAITPSDSASNVCDAIYVGGAGNITLQDPGTLQTVLFTAVPVGTTLEAPALKVMSTGTTATALVGLLL